MCPSPVGDMLSLPGTSPTLQHQDEKPLQPGASNWASQHISSLVFPLEQQARGAVTCLIERFGLFVFLVLITNWCYKGNQRATLRHSQ